MLKVSGVTFPNEHYLHKRTLLGSFPELGLSPTGFSRSYLTYPESYEVLEPF